MFTVHAFCFVLDILHTSLYNYIGMCPPKAISHYYTSMYLQRNIEKDLFVVVPTYTVHSTSLHSQVRLSIF